VLITEWDQLESRAGLLSRAAGSGLGWFRSRERIYLHVLLLYSELWVEDSELPESTADTTIFEEILTMPALKKEREYIVGKQWRWNGKGQRTWGMNMIKALCLTV
jgi:hypothetical protein